MKYVNTYLKMVSHIRSVGQSNGYHMIHFGLNMFHTRAAYDDCMQQL